MALHDRVHSLETEYGVQYVAARGHRPNTGSVVEALKREARRAYGLPGTDFLANGSRLHQDVGHAEWALPECRSAYEAAVYDKAADHLLLHQLLPRVDAGFAQQGGQGRVVMIKNNTDFHGNTYGCHENYQMLRDADLLQSGDFLRYCVQCLVPFLVTRQILVGAGSLIEQQRSGALSVRYALSQRAAYIEAIVSRDTTRHRAIFNLGREGESLGGERHRRLHQILGDANLSGWATFVKLGSTGLMLRLVEDLFFDTVPVLADALQALRTISGDLKGKTPFALQDGRTITALEIQWFYYNQADAYLNLFGASAEDEQLMELWGQALEDYGRDPLLLRDRADWAIKKHLLDAFLQQQDRTLESLRMSDRELITELRALDLRYHELSPQGLYCRLYPIDTLVTRAEILRAEQEPPSFTRARVRGEALWLGRVVMAEAEFGPWQELVLEKEHMPLNDPLDFDHRSLVIWDRPGAYFEAQCAGGPPDHALLHKLGRAAYYARHYQRALEFFEQAVRQQREDHVCLQAVAATCNALGRYQDAIRWFEQQHRCATETGNEDEIDYIGLGSAWRLSGDFRQAMTVYRKAIQAEPQQAAVAYTHIAGMHLKRGEVRSAETSYRQALQRWGDMLGAFVGLGVILLVGSDQAAGRDLLQKACDLPLRRMERHLLPASEAIVRAVARLALGEAGALQALESALSCRMAEADDGRFVLQPWLDLLRQATPPIPDIEAARLLAQQAGAAPATETPPAETPPASLEWIRAGAQHPSPEVRQRALAYAGWRLQDLPPGAVSPFVAVLLENAQSDPDPRVRRVALSALGHPVLRDTPAMDALIACLHDPDPAVRWAAQAALEQITLPGTPVIGFWSGVEPEAGVHAPPVRQPRETIELVERMRRQWEHAEPDSDATESEYDDIPF